MSLSCGISDFFSLCGHHSVSTPKYHLHEESNINSYSTNESKCEIVSNNKTKRTISYETFRAKHRRRKTSDPSDEFWNSTSTVSSTDIETNHAFAHLDHAIAKYENLIPGIKNNSIDWMKQINEDEMNTQDTNLQAITKRINNAFKLSCTNRNTPEEQYHSILPASYDNKEELSIPENYIGVYQRYCIYQSWSPVFARPGDFTFRLQGIRRKKGEILLLFAVICCSIQYSASTISPRSKRGDNNAFHPSSEQVNQNNSNYPMRRKSYVKYVECSQTELLQLSEALTLKCIGHRLMEKLPIAPTMLTFTSCTMDQYKEAVAQYLSYIFNIQAIGFNDLVQLRESMSQNLLLREFLKLPLICVANTQMKEVTTSCDARIEQTMTSRPILPPEWFDVSHSTALLSPESMTQKEDLTQLSFTRLCLGDDGQYLDMGYGASAYSEFNHRKLTSLTQRSLYDIGKLQSFPYTKVQRKQSNYAGRYQGYWIPCYQFISPYVWRDLDTSDVEDGAFTIEISGCTVVEGTAKFTISILSYYMQQITHTSVNRRYNEFATLVSTLEKKYYPLTIHHILPQKSFFRSVSPQYLETRAYELQSFLEHLLTLFYKSSMCNEMAMASEPSVRKFLGLPTIDFKSNTHSPSISEDKISHGNQLDDSFFDLVEQYQLDNSRQLRDPQSPPKYNTSRANQDEDNQTQHELDSMSHRWRYPSLSFNCTIGKRRSDSM